MSDKKQLAAIGAKYRLTEEQAKGLAERMPKTGVLQVIDDEPLCMTKRIEELEAQVRVMAESLREAISVLSSINHGGEHEIHIEGDEPAFWQRGEWVDWAKSEVLPKLQAALAGKLPEPVMQEGWELVPVEPTQEMILAGVAAQAEKLKRYALGGSLHPIDHGMPDAYRAMLAAAPSPDSAK